MSIRKKNISLAIINKTMLARIVDLLIVLFICLNVIAFDFPVFNIPLRYIIFILILPISYVADSKNHFSFQYLRFIFFVITIYAMLFLYSVLRNNEFENILIFLRPLLVLFAIPAFQFVFKKYGINRYLKAFSIACIVMIVIFLCVFTLSVIDFNFANTLNDKEGLINVNIHQVLPRVVVKTFVFIIPFSAYIMNKIIGWRLHIFFILMMLISLLSQTFGIVLTIIAIYFYILKTRGLNFNLVLSICIILSIYLIFDSLYLDEMISSKEGSADIKVDQVRNMFKDMDIISFLFGRGIGCNFTNFDSRLISEPIIEVVSVQIFQMGGLLFSFLILYVYLFPAIKALKYKNSNIRFLALYQIGIFLASMFNPYLWGGGTGLLFVAMLEASSKSQMNNINNVAYNHLK